MKNQSLFEHLQDVKKHDNESLWQFLWDNDLGEHHGTLQKYASNWSIQLDDSTDILEEAIGWMNSVAPDLMEMEPDWVFFATRYINRVRGTNDDSR